MAKTIDYKAIESWQFSFPLNFTFDPSSSTFVVGAGGIKGKIKVKSNLKERKKGKEKKVSGIKITKNWSQIKENISCHNFSA